MIRIGDVDSIDHITEFESAADYTITLRKWQEMNVPISLALPPRTMMDEARSLLPNESVFEASLDNTERGRGETNNARWKFKGPWLASKSESEFRKYVEKRIRWQKDAFREVLRSELQARIVEDQKRIATDLGKDFKPGLIEISEGDLDAFIRQLRQQRKKLHQLIEKFLDLPNYEELTGQVPTTTHFSGRTKTKEHVFLEDGPPKTHPAAGLSYLRTASHIHNHPILGPQQVEPPVQGRILRPRNPQVSREMRASIGVAGVVAEDDRPAVHKRTVPRGVAEFDPDIPGGTKDWYHPEHASINSRGRLNLNIKHTDAHTLAIYEGISEQKEENIDASVISGGDRQFPWSSSPSAASRETSKQGYGLEGIDQENRSERATPVDVSQDELLRLLNTGKAQPPW